MSNLDREGRAITELSVPTTASVPEAPSGATEGAAATGGPDAPSGPTEVATETAATGGPDAPSGATEGAIGGEGTGGADTEPLLVGEQQKKSPSSSESAVRSSQTFKKKLRLPWKKTRLSPVPTSQDSPEFTSVHFSSDGPILKNGNGKDKKE